MCVCTKQQLSTKCNLGLLSSIHWGQQTGKVKTVMYCRWQSSISEWTWLNTVLLSEGLLSLATLSLLLFFLHKQKIKSPCLVADQHNWKKQAQNLVYRESNHICSWVESVVADKHAVSLPQNEPLWPSSTHARARTEEFTVCLVFTHSPHPFS